MRSVVIYESMYGNNHRVAELIGSALEECGSVIVVHVSKATDELVGSADLVVVGGPTHVRSLSTRASRASALEAAQKSSINCPDAPLSMDPHWQAAGIRDWFRTSPPSHGQFAAAFDTRLLARSLLTGRASRVISRRLARHGYELIAEPESFLVDSQTRLLGSEAERATHWARGLATSILHA
ncbi:MAG: flavodoxin domain-containing protein [Actinomycetota bacterium]|nr:flavodoxin domain-containing protein [Actinomycetota bacterium]